MCDSMKIILFEKPFFKQTFCKRPENRNIKQGSGHNRTNSPVTFITHKHFANLFSLPALLMRKLTNYISAGDLAATYISEVCVIAKWLQGKSRLYIHVR